MAGLRIGVQGERGCVVMCVCACELAHSYLCVCVCVCVCVTPPQCQAAVLHLRPEY